MTITTNYSWQYKLNPDNTPWVPGYRFCVIQRAKTSVNTWRMAVRHYRVRYDIDPDGNLKWAGGVKPTEATQREVEEMYAAGRPGSNGAPV
jgi:hypothetical protein